MIIKLSYSNKGESMDYTGVMRTTLSEVEKKALKKLASSKGMTVVGFTDALIRERLKNETSNTERSTS